MAVEHVAVIGGTGDEGFGLAARWATAGIDVTIGSRDEGRAAEAADRLKGLVPSASVSGATNDRAVAGSDLVVVTVPFGGQAVIYKAIAPHVRDDAVIVDCTVPVAAAIGAKVTHTLGVWEGSAAQQGWSFLERGTMCAAFHSLGAVHLNDLDHVMEGDVLVCGSKKAAKARVKELVEAIPKLRYVDAGPLENARIVEPITALLIGINMRYKVHGSGIQITGLPD
ncbi:MAG TPA: NADPH-dependent F420 reductase [Actinomycetota bacterium]|nr:NADPH-dependent F420 reductase [Actinomycetota bacterium]